MLTFNNRGLLVPNYNLPSTVDEMEEMFVRDIDSHARRDLFENYKTYLNILSEVVGHTPFVQWVDGSFTTRKPEPSDIDIVSFIPFDVVENVESALQPLKYPQSLSFGIDAYIVKVYPSDHRLAALYYGDRAYWMDKFDKTPRNRRGVIYPKGFLELTINK
ncbi:hypothetical protein F5984_00655 [Rudanella paleaurantiibacter]|uniref:Uncharacterized protein n=1 Tax=Rudanella paleaurantiibacter TaxID=2614655 RepID=A0A7J5U410_9BACT|nr:hypothetical protein [Rudanella paleaurantiibacter]KAB7732505.1 hypothetical protein F5984_00655 [Rudanella paleaurantiibacter]